MLLTLEMFLAVLPVALLLVFVYSKDKSKEPLSLLLELFFLGILSGIIVTEISHITRIIFPFYSKKIADMNFFEVLFYSFIEVALVEELCKWIMIYIKGYNNQEFDEIYDIIVYAVFVSLGFALIENVTYVFIRASLKTALLRAISSVPGHACFAILMGYYLSLAKQFHYKKKYNLEKKYLVLSILVPTLIHGIYDFCLMSRISILMFVFWSFVILLYIKSFITLREVSLANKRMFAKHKFCDKCGYKIDGDTCSKCGNKQE